MVWVCRTEKSITCMDIDISTAMPRIEVQSIFPTEHIAIHPDIFLTFTRSNFHVCTIVNFFTGSRLGPKNIHLHGENNSILSPL